MTRKYFPHSTLKIFGFFIAAILFGAASFFLLYMAKGYVFELNGLKINFKKTGMIIYSSKPSDGKVTLNGKKVKKGSGSSLFPSKIYGLLAGDYDLRLEKENYLPWEKKLHIEQGFVTWANYILLFPQNPVRDTVIEDGKITAAESSPDNRKIAFIYETLANKQEIWLLDTLNLSKTKLMPASQTQEEMLASNSVLSMNWSEDSSKVLLKFKSKEKNGFFVMNTRDPENSINLNEMFKMDFDNLIWSPTDSSELFWLKESNLYKVNLSNKTLSASLADKIVSINTSESRSLYLVRDLSGERSMWTIDTAGGNLTKIIKSLPNSKNYQVRTSNKNNDILVIVDGEVRTLYMVKNIGDKVDLIELSKSSTDANWSEDGKKVLYSNEKNIWAYDLEKSKEFEVAKDVDVKFVSWYDDFHLAVNIAGEYKIIEMDGGNPVLIGKSSISKVFFSPDSRYLFYLGRHENRQDNLFIYNLKF